MAIRRFSTAKPGVKSNQLWDQDTAQGAMVPIAQVVGIGTNSNMNFFNIPSSYKDLIIILTATSNSSHSGNMIFNFASSGTYSGTYLTGNGSAAASSRITSNGAGPMLKDITYGTITPTTTIITIHDYANTSKFKSYTGKNAGDNNGSGQVQIFSGLWQKTEAIYEILLSTGSASIFWTGVATLYGIKAGA
jgi:hypothetical protein